VKRASQFALGLLLTVALRGAAAQTATVMTDQADYAPGTIVTITGTGWQPGETVTLSFVESPLIDTHPDLYATADANGNIFNNQFSPDSHDVNITFTLTATGQTSGLVAQTTFTDASNDGTGSMTVSPTTAIAGSTGNSFTFTFATDSGKDLLTGAQVTVQVPSGWTAPQNTNSGNAGFVNVTNVSCATAPSISSVGGGLITININCTKGGQSFTLAYAGGGTKVTAPTTAGLNTFTTQTKQNGGTLTNIATSPVVTVNAAAASKLVFTNTAITVTAGVCSSALTIQSQDSFGNPSNVTGTETLAPSASPSAGASFYTDNTCTTVVTGSNLTIPSGSNTGTFFFKDTTAGSVTLTVSGTGAFTTGTGTNATQTETVNASAARRGQTIVAGLLRKEHSLTSAGGGI
jgi:hypothetical protein